MAGVVEIVLQGKDEASAAIKGVGDSLGGLGSLAAGAVTAGLAAAAAGFVALAGGMALSFSAALDNEKLQAQLAQTIKSTGGAAGLTADAANKLAQQFTNLAGGSDDAILAIETIGLRAGTVSATEMPRFIQTTLDLGAVMGSTEAAATLLARAQEDVSGAVAKATRAGIIFTPELKAQIKAMEDAGDAAGATRLFMDRLAEATGGAALANSKTFSGQLEIFKGSLGEAAETIGMAFLPVAHELFDKVLKPAIPVIQAMAQQLADHLPAAISMVQATFTQLWTYLQPVLQEFWTWLSVNLPPAMKELAKFWKESILPAVAAFSDWYKLHGAPALKALAGFLKNELPFAIKFLSNAFEGLKIDFAIVTDILRGDWDKLGKDLVKLWETNQKQIRHVLDEAIKLIKQIDWPGIGMHIAEGIARGIEAGARKVISSALNVGRDLKEAIRNALGIWSPSKVFQGYGVNLMEGLALGITGGAPMAAAAMRQASGQVINSATNNRTVNVNVVNNLQRMDNGMTAGQARALAGAL